MQEIKKIERKNKAQEVLYSAAGVFIMLGAYAMTPVTCPVGAVLGLTANGTKCGPRHEGETKDMYAKRKKRVRKNNAEAMLEGMKRAFEVPYEAFADLRGLALQDGRTRIAKYNEAIKKAEEEARAQKMAQEKAEKEEQARREYEEARLLVSCVSHDLKQALEEAGLGYLLGLISTSEVNKATTIKINGVHVLASKVRDWYITEQGEILDVDTKKKKYTTITVIPEQLQIYIRAAIDIKAEAQEAQKKADEIARVNSVIQAEYKNACRGK